MSLQNRRYGGVERGGGGEKKTQIEIHFMIIMITKICWIFSDAERVDLGKVILILKS